MTVAIVENGTLVISVGSFAASIAAKSIEHQFDALTHFPDRRANIELDELAARLNDFAAYVENLADKGDIAPEFNGVAEVEAFALRHVDLARRFWAAEGRCMNWFITGPARFPVARNEKRMKVADARRADLGAHPVAARKAVKRKALPHGADDEPIRSGDPAAVEKIKAKIEALALSIDKAKAANAIIRRMEKDGADRAERSMPNDVGEARRISTAFLKFLEEDRSTSLILAATNHAKLLDRALFRRFDAIFNYDLPDEAQARAVLANNLTTFDVTRLDWDRLIAEAKGMSHCDIARGAADAARTAVLDHDGDLDTDLLVTALADRRRGHAV
ncbi:AAA family ATPase [Mesorhizobium sp. AR07]|uniref:AAA family ATPase n=1 Tax=Mesorhizobium sp. AR07 TaxID=2865838 RepID=UPI00215FB3E1|nr:AAA family ATPase [Mesorhizobium sp. AR07]